MELSSLSKDVSYGLTEWGIRDEDHYRKLHRFAVTERDLFETCRTTALSCCARGPAGTSVCRRSNGQRDIQSRCRKNRTHPIKGAATTLRRLSDEGYRIRIITHRLFINFFHEASVRQTIRWLEKHGVPYRDLCFMGEKDQVGADVYIDDSPDNSAALRAAGTLRAWTNQPKKPCSSMRWTQSYLTRWRGSGTNHEPGSRTSSGCWRWRRRRQAEHGQ